MPENLDTSAAAGGGVEPLPSSAMATAYWIAIYRSISDLDRHAQYARIAGPAIAAAGGRFLARSSEFTSLSPDSAVRVVLIEFPSHEAALQTYRSDEYQRACAVLGDAVERDVRIVTALD
ncbi:hypothetical protein D806_033240 [Mycolicibacterium smegmatis MKD8]|uniref:DUF1330 domain-containing protein n=2 Tax=Mycolicibacterium smegmatis TaxID=1772 RepID=A0A2U9PR95_MYCSE|nr:hypothetical protein D806_033240 [Mycolicibacterium smegmatis MKD8]